MRTYYTLLIVATLCPMIYGGDLSKCKKCVSSPDGGFICTGCIPLTEAPKSNIFPNFENSYCNSVWYVNDNIYATNCTDIKTTLSKHDIYDESIKSCFPCTCIPKKGCPCKPCFEWNATNGADMKNPLSCLSKHLVCTNTECWSFNDECYPLQVE